MKYTPEQIEAMVDDVISYASMVCYAASDYERNVHRLSLRDAKETLLAALASQIAAQKQDGVEFRLWDTQWMNIVNHENAYRGWFMEDAIAHAVKATENAMARNIADGKWPTKQTSSPNQDREVSP